MNSGTTNPTVASIAARPCFSSASRNHGTHSGARSAKPAGSQFELVVERVNGIGSGPSPPTYPLQKTPGTITFDTGASGTASTTSTATSACNLVLIRFRPVGANADVDPVTKAITMAAVLIIVQRLGNIYIAA